MRETDFIEQNKNKWTELEGLLGEEKKDPDKLSNLFIQVTDDLSYSRTFYPNRSVRLYLNNMAQQLFYRIYKNRKIVQKQFINFWKEELPQLVYTARKDLLFAFFVFVVAFLIGVVSSANDAHFPRVILGDEYVNKTIENIKKGDPMAVYKSQRGIDMFFGITLNNIRVAFITFLLGIFYVVGTVVMLLYNGIMVGAFQYFFYERGLFLHSFLSIWLHGTLEMSSIIIGAGAGITMGKGLLFPGSYSRMQSFLISARRGVKILLGVVPIIVMAAIIESFMTRYSEAPDIIKASIIFLSLLFIVGYFVWYPFVKSRRGFAAPLKEVKLPASQDYKINIRDIKTNGEIFKDIFIFYRNYFSKLFRIGLALSFVTMVIAGILHFTGNTFHVKYRDWFFIRQFFDYDKAPLFMIIHVITISLNILFSYKLFEKYIRGDAFPKKQTAGFYILSFLKIAFVVFLFNCAFFVNGFLAFLAIVIAAPFLLLWTFIAYYNRMNLLSSFSRTFSLLNVSVSKVYGLFIMLALIGVIYFFMIDSPLIYFYFEIINWNLSMERETIKEIILMLMVFTSFFAVNLILPMVLIGNGLVYFSLVEIDEAHDLNERIETLVQKEKAGGK
jgi:uncharacterized membrane protein SpoIIM required for sporulation